MMIWIMLAPLPAPQRLHSSKRAAIKAQFRQLRDVLAMAAMQRRIYKVNATYAFTATQGEPKRILMNNFSIF